MKCDLMDSEVDAIVSVAVLNPHPGLLHFISGVLVNSDSSVERCTMCMSYIINLAAVSQSSRSISFLLLSNLVRSPNLRPEIIELIKYYLKFLDPASGPINITLDEIKKIIKDADLKKE